MLGHRLNGPLRSYLLLVVVIIFSAPPLSGSPPLWSTTVGVGGTRGCAMLSRTRSWHPFVPPCSESPAIRRRARRVFCRTRQRRARRGPSCAVHLLICGRDIARTVHVCCEAAIVSRPSHHQRPAATASLSRAIQTGPLDPGSAAHVCSFRASASAVLPWLWAVRFGINGPGLSTSL